jgi:peptidoglycan hydrolase-like protein with peptidoglycan-binding domain
MWVLTSRVRSRRTSKPGRMRELTKQGTRGLALVLLFVCALAASAATAAKKKASTAKKQAASIATRKTSSAATSRKGSATTGRKGTTARKGTSTTARRHIPAAPPRQSTPSPARYREIQQALAERGYTDSTPDGVWGAQWVDSLRRFQADQNLQVDGKLGALSIIALGLGPKRQALQLPPPGASNQTMPGQQLLAKPVE